MSSRLEQSASARRASGVTRALRPDLRLVSALKRAHKERRGLLARCCGRRIYQHRQFSGELPASAAAAPSNRRLTSEHEDDLACENEDDFHSPMRPDDYIALRVRPKLAFYRARIPHYARRRTVLRCFLFACTASGSIIADLANEGDVSPRWAVVVTAAAAAFTSWMEFADIGRKVERYTRAVVDIQNLLSSWKSLSDVERSNPHEIAELVRNGESILSNERIAWVSTANRSLQGRGGEKGDDARKAKQTKSLQSALSRVDSSIGLVCLCGNHDVGNVPSRKSIRDFRNNYGEDYGLFRCGDHRCVVINSQLVNSKEKFWQGLRKEQCAEIEPVARQQDNWLDSLPPNEPSLIFSHIPPFIFADDEPKGYFNHEPAVRRHLLAQIRRLDRRAKWFTGHFHRNAGGFSDELEVVVTSAVGCALAWKVGVAEEERLGLEGFDWKKRGCSDERSGLRCVCVRGTEVRHRFFSLKDVPEDPLMESEAW